MAQKREYPSEYGKKGFGFGRIQLIITIAAVILVVLFIAVAAGKENTDAEDADVSRGTAYLQELEAQSTDSVENDIQQKKIAEQSQQGQQKLDELLSGDVDVWSMFSDYVILGDSRAEGFYVYQYLPESRVLAEKGDSYLAIDDHLTEIQNLSPLHIYVTYGMNDISNGLVSSTDGFWQLVTEQTAKLRDAAPNATIYICSILPVTDAAIAETPTLGDAGTYNTVLEQVCSEQGYRYVDNSEVVANHSDLYEPDGIHFNAAFYEYWAANMLTAQYQ